MRQLQQNQQNPQNKSKKLINFIVMILAILIVFTACHKKKKPFLLLPLIDNSSVATTNGSCDGGSGSGVGMAVADRPLHQHKVFWTIVLIVLVITKKHLQ
jgi:hypothetical protein